MGTIVEHRESSELIAKQDAAVLEDAPMEPIWIGEFGSYERADYDSRVRYTRLVRSEIEARGFSWAYWELASRFGIYDPAARKWRTELRDALLGGPT